MTASPIYAALGLSRNPFPPTPDAGSYFFTPRLEEDFAEIVHCIEARKGFVLLTGEVGLGKSTLVRRLLDTLQGKNCHSALILNTFLQDSALLSAIQADFGLAPSATLEQGLARLTDFLVAGHQAGDINLLVIDDAQNLSVESLELVRLLCNLETGQEKLLQILLVGQPELEQTLARPELRQLKSRIVKHARLSALHKDEVARYFDFRVNAAGAEGRLSLEPAAAQVLYRATQGNLRRIHLVLDRCLYGLASARASVVTGALVQRAVADLPALEGESASDAAAPVSRRRKAWILAGLLAGTTATVAVASLGLAPQRQAIAPGAHAVAQGALLPTPAESAPARAAPGAAQAPASAASADPVSPRRACQRRLEGLAAPGEVVHVQRVPEGISDTLKLLPGLCRFAEGNEAWVAWVGRDDARSIVAAQQVTRQVQARLKSAGLLDARERDDGFLVRERQRRLHAFSNSTVWPPPANPTS
ncbi:AAA ATPase [Acidovorax delafieldii 2AN]|uniref:AAA ATPase n=1 Tax=Acidovorax delafieldii 2AN TaxID=573060 RepID=C5T4G6_ACIDE|nr:AAA family ATPase [Acidovorax delafieldii]EER60648.1 AAA ATPase [Acidovorax delafieldii 2AN]